MAPEHRITGTEHTGGAWIAACACGHRERITGTDTRTRSRVLVRIYTHVIDALRPECPTPHKIQYANEIQARNAIANFLRYTSPGPRPVRAYRCPSGRHWHTSKTSHYERKAA